MFELSPVIWTGRNEKHPKQRELYRQTFWGGQVLGGARSREKCRVLNGIGARKGRAGGREVYGKTVWRHLGGGLSYSSGIS